MLHHPFNNNSMFLSNHQVDWSGATVGDMVWVSDDVEVPHSNQIITFHDVIFSSSLCDGLTRPPQQLQPYAQARIQKVFDSRTLVVQLERFKSSVKVPTLFCTSSAVSVSHSTLTVFSPTSKSTIATTFPYVHDHFNLRSRIAEFSFSHSYLLNAL